jgi:hypothetical protein
MYSILIKVTDPLSHSPVVIELFDKAHNEAKVRYDIAESQRMSVREQYNQWLRGVATIGDAVMYADVVFPNGHIVDYKTYVAKQRRRPSITQRSYYADHMDEWTSVTPTSRYGNAWTSVKPTSHYYDENHVPLHSGYCTAVGQSTYSYRHMKPSALMQHALRTIQNIIDHPRPSVIYNRQREAFEIVGREKFTAPMLGDAIGKTRYYTEGGNNL